MSGPAASRRRLAGLWVADWPVIAAIMAGEAPADQPVMVVDTRRVLAVSATARRAGARCGMKRRTAQNACPQAQLVPADGARDARVFDQVATVLERQVPGVEPLRPGLALCPAIGASRYHGSDQSLAEHLVNEITAQTGTEAMVGVADGVLAAILATREGRIIAPGESPAYLAPRPLSDLELALRGTAAGANLDVLTSLLHRLGVRRLGDLANLPLAAVTERFGAVGVWAWRLAKAQDARIWPAHQIAREFVVLEQAEPPVANVEAAAFWAKRLAGELHQQLAEFGQSYDRLRATALSERGEELSRTWRLEGADVKVVRDKVRWQLEGWLTGRSGLAPTGGLVQLELRAEEVHPAGYGSARLWGTDSQAQARAARGADRLQSLLGESAVYRPVLQGGRDPRGRIRLVQWGDQELPLRPLDRPWPGTLPDPAPSVVPGKPWPVSLVDAQGRPVRVSATLELSGPPHQLDGEVIQGWAGPWPVVERWWGPEATRQVYLQVKMGPGSKAALLACQDGAWQVEGVYD